MSGHSVDCECLACREYWWARDCARSEDVGVDEGSLSQTSEDEAAGIFYSVTDGSLPGGRRKPTPGSGAKRSA